MRYLPDPSWSALGAIGRSPISKLSILMPFVGYLILLQDDIMRWVNLADFEGGGELKVGISFYCLYFGLFLFGFGSFIFHLAAPATAKGFMSADDYVERLHNLVTSSDLLPKLERILEAAPAGSAVSTEATLYKSTVSAGISTQHQPALKAFTLRGYFNTLDLSRPAIRYFVLILFVTGILLSAVPSVVALMTVWSSFSSSYLL